MSVRTSKKTILELRELTKEYGRFRGIKSVSFNVLAGEVFGFLGPNGAGKSTTIRTLMNFQRPTSGQALIFGRDSVKNAKELKSQIGYLAGDFTMYENLTGEQYVTFIAKLRGVEPHEAQPLAKRLQADLHKRIKTLSRGNKQKIGLIAALMHDPDLLILDEPTTGLDPLMQNEFYSILKEHTAKGKTVFMSSHILSEVQLVCDRVAFMKEGVLAETIDVHALKNEGKKEVIIINQPGNKLMQLPAFKNLEVLSHNKEETVFVTNEPSKSLLRWLSLQPVSDVTIQNVTLEDMFLKLYSGESNDKTVQKVGNV